ncbi:unnamed protein product, partial [Coregonus sp. 'balchen']
MDGGKEGWRPFVYSVTLMLSAAALVLACGAYTIYSAMQGWRYIESLYFCFMAFRRWASGHGEQPGRVLPRSPQWRLAGMLYLHPLQCPICHHKQGLIWILSQLIHLRSCLCHGRPLRCPLFPMFLLNL